MPISQLISKRSANPSATWPSTSSTPFPPTLNEPPACASYWRPKTASSAPSSTQTKPNHHPTPPTNQKAHTPYGKTRNRYHLRIHPRHPSRRRHPTGAGPRRHLRRSRPRPLRRRRFLAEENPLRQVHLRPPSRR